MKLSARMIQNLTTVNNFGWTDQAQFTQGDTASVYFQLIDDTQDKAVKGFYPAGRRYVPAAGATLSVKLDNINDAIAITRAAFQPFPLDPSIWQVQVLATDTIVGTCALALTLTEGAVVTRGRVEAAVEICPTATV